SSSQNKTRKRRGGLKRITTTSQESCAAERSTSKNLSRRLNPFELRFRRGVSEPAALASRGFPVPASREPFTKRLKTVRRYSSLCARLMQCRFTFLGTGPTTLLRCETSPENADCVSTR